MNGIVSGERWSLERDLPSFFKSYKELRNAESRSIKSKSASYLDTNSFGSWFSRLGTPLMTARRNGAFCDPWIIAGLARDEIRNAQVLAWLLNPKGSHGLGGCVLESLLKEINRRACGDIKKMLPDGHGRFCIVRTEISPNGDSNSRFDIEIDDENFYLVSA